MTGEFNKMSAVATPTVELTVTENAAEEIKKFLAGEDDLPETSGLRVRVVPGGCSGFQYSLNIEEESKSGDFVVEKHGIKLFVDMFSAQYLNGITIDHTSNIHFYEFTSIYDVCRRLSKFPFPTKASVVKVQHE